MDASPNTRTALLTRIEGFLERTGMAPSALGERADVGSEIVKKLRRGGDCTTRTADKLNAFMDAWPNVPPNRRRVMARRRVDQSAAPRS